MSERYYVEDGGYVYEPRTFTTEEVIEPKELIGEAFRHLTGALISEVDAKVAAEIVKTMVIRHVQPIYGMGFIQEQMSRQLRVADDPSS